MREVPRVGNLLRELHSTVRKNRTVEEAAEWINAPGKKQSTEERAANLGAILAAQAHWLTERLLDRQAHDFEKGGGFSERLYKARTGGNNRPNGRNSQNG